MADPNFAELVQLCELVLATNIEEDELKSAWPQESADPQLSELRATLFSALEHRPGTVTDGQWQLNLDAWRRTPEYEDIQLYLERLRQVSP